MIEVEKKFRPTEDQLKVLLVDAEFLGKKVLKDIYYDYPDYELFNQKIYFRDRNGNFELKIGDDEIAGISEEIEREEDIKKYFKTEKSIPEFISEHMMPIIEYTTERTKYKKGEFSLDVDSLSFGYECVEIEILVGDKAEVDEAHKRIIAFAQSYDFEIKNIPAKRREYFRIIKPEVYKQLYK